MKESTQPTLEWYREQSRSAKVATHRCPFASIERCPRFYQSVALLGDAGVSTRLSPDENGRLMRMWQRTDLWPRVSESLTSVSGPSDQPKHFRNFCPEVAFERFQVFAVALSRYSDEIDEDLAHHRLAEQKAEQNDWRWGWSLLTPMHFTDCPLYSPLLAGGTQPSWIAMTKDKSELDPFRVVVSVIADSDQLVRLATAAGVKVDLSEPEGMSTNKLRMRAYVPRVLAAYDALSERDQVRAATAAVREVQRWVPADELSDALRSAGWALNDGRLVVASEEAREVFFPKGSQWDAFVVLRDIFTTAQSSVMIVDAYCDKKIFSMLASRNLDGITVKILCSQYAASVAAEGRAFMAQHPQVMIEVRSARDFHDRFVIIDDGACTHIGASLKDAGKTAFMVSKVEDENNRSALVAAVHTSWVAATLVP